MSAPRDEWQSVAEGWRRWEPMFQSFSWPLALRMAAAAEIGSAHRVLDVGCGIGDPTLQVAVLVGPLGRVLEQLRRCLAPGGRIAITAWAPPEVNPWFTLPHQALARVRQVPPPDPRVPGVFHLSSDGALARALVGAGFQTVGQERVVLSQLAHDGAEFWRMMADTAGPLAPLIEGLAPAEREGVAADVAGRLERYRAGDVLRIPAQAQLAWGRA